MQSLAFRRAVAAVAQRRAFSAAPRVLAGAPSGSRTPTRLDEGFIEADASTGMPTPFYTNLPGPSEPGKVPTNLEVAVGLERYEYLETLDGKVPFESLLPLIVTEHKPTKKNPLVVSGIDEEAYVACTGFPADAHEPIWLTLKDNGYAYRCPTCGGAYKYNQVGKGHGGHGHH
ncbi:Rubredoxin-like protein [Gonapodya prolifera JEL478]|uniref:Rubredoxin-like protein n=1 Tax=Gonapodya prolifera (strain JEL478) TaxID=1344416 RepID=A0A139A466_GONPJ|nr:Rubredoxin-like protein [Gonapodya prolifera JEL478]|eukprot:KXS11469.1 Rubredoxin-like protein [Gonapodya prolifera JEL478]